MLKLEGVLATNRKFQLGPISIDVGTGYTVLAGHNGAGKTTMMRCITGIQKPVSGSITIGGFHLGTGRGFRGAVSITGYCPQDAQLPTRATVAQVLTFSAWLKGLTVREAAAAAERVAVEMNLVDYLGTKCGKLSGGTRQRVVVGQALAHDPLVLVLDEPTVGLDPVQRVSLRELLREIAHERTVLVSTHLVEDVEETADRVLVLKNGMLTFDGTTEDLEAEADAGAHGKSGLERGLWRLLSEEVQ